MIVKKPSIVIYVNDPDAACLRNLCAGVEEEGVLYQVEARPMADAAALADAAAQDSVLGSGVGLAGTAAAMQLRGCPAGKPVFQFPNASAEVCRALGADSARAIKKLPFKTGKGTMR